jgi:hypothetical protein
MFNRAGARLDRQDNSPPRSRPQAASLRRAAHFAPGDAEQRHAARLIDATALSVPSLPKGFRPLREESKWKTPFTPITVAFPSKLMLETSALGV